MLRLGLKLFATNTYLAAQARQLLEEGVFAYIELYVPPGTYADTIAVWRQCPGRYVIHGPHWGHGVNLSDPTLRHSNRQILSDAQRFADALDAPYIIVHGGFGLHAEEVATQAAALTDPRLAMENVPCIGTGRQRTTIYTSQHMAALLQTGAVRHTVLDMGHAIYAANTLARPWEALMREFLALRPALLHLSDGDSRATADVHKAIGAGDFDLAALVALLPPEADVTLETPRLEALLLEEARRDARALRELLDSIPAARPVSPEWGCRAAAPQGESA